MRVQKLDKSEWSVMSADAHLVTFGKAKPSEWDRIDFALVVEDFVGNPCSYVTCREMDHETLYWQFGGSLPGTRGTIRTMQTMAALLRYCRERYKRVTFLVENNNEAMLKLAMKVGFRIVGIRNFKGNVLLEHVLEF